MELVVVNPRQTDRLEAKRLTHEPELLTALSMVPTSDGEMHYKERDSSSIRPLDARLKRSD